MTWAPLLALGAALGFGVASILLRRGLQYMTPHTATVISVTATTVFIWLLVAVTVPPSVVWTPAVVPFLIAGLLAPGLSRLMLFMGVDRIGVARSSAVVSAAPLFAVLLAILALGERPSGALLVGAVAVVGGGVLLSSRGRLERHWRRRDMVFPLLAALGFALRDNISRWALRDFPQPMVAAAAATLSSLAVIWLFAAVQWRTGRIRFHPTGVVIVTLGGLAEGLAYLTMWRALALGEVSVVSPLVNAHAFVTIVLATLFLRDLERITWRMVVACALIIGGVGLVLGGAS